MLRILTLLLIFLFSVQAWSQDTIYLSKALTAMTPNRYGREALYTDALAYKLYTGILRAPADGDSFMTNDRGQLIKWQAVTADSTNRFRGRGFAQGYFYFRYNSDKEKKRF